MAEGRTLRFTSLLSQAPASASYFLLLHYKSKNCMNFVVKHLVFSLRL